MSNSQNKTVSKLISKQKKSFCFRKRLLQEHPKPLIPILVISSCLRKNRVLTLQMKSLFDQSETVNVYHVAFCSFSRDTQRFHRRYLNLRIGLKFMSPNYIYQFFKLK